MNDENLKPCKPGETHNPNGRPKGSRSFKTVLKEMLAGIDSQKDWGNPIAKKLIQIAFGKGEDGKPFAGPEQQIKAIREMLDRIDGKSLQKSEVDMKGELSIPKATLS